MPVPIYRARFVSRLPVKAEFQAAVARASFEPVQKTNVVSPSGVSTEY